MRLVIATAVLIALSGGASPEVAPPSPYWLFLQNDNHTWCGYTNMADFILDVKKLMPTETATVTYSSDKLTEVMYQVEPESRDWVVVDRYTPSNDGLILRRTNLLVQDNLEIIEETSIRDGKAEQFRVLSTTTLDGKKAEASNVDLPPVPITTTLSRMPFLAVVAEMRKQSTAKVCKAF